MRQSDQPLPDPPRNDRPDANWICGWNDAGTPCEHGPGGTGVCPALSACHPTQKGNDWTCNRPACLGGKCETGPNGEGICGLKPTPCVPKRSWRSRRKAAVTLCCLSAIGFICIGLGGPWRTEVFAPGGLTRPHAQILGGELKSERCASCHPAAMGSIANWFASAGDAHKGVTQTQLCMECHHNTIENSLARNAHNLPLSQLSLIGNKIAAVTDSWHKNLPGPVVAMNDVACATCHREHHGAQFNLSALTSHQCQTCHKERFASFSDGHPEWSDWPYDRGGQISFSHASHKGKHFPQTQASFDCNRCHEKTQDNEIARNVSFETGCASCHEKPLNVSSSQGFAAFQFPMLDLDALSAAGMAVQSWPQDATGGFDGKIPPIMRLLLQSNPEVSSALNLLPKGGDLARVNPKNSQQIAAIKVVADEIRQLLQDIEENGAKTFARRLGTTTGIDEQTAIRIAGTLSPQMIASARQNWFPGEDSLALSLGSTRTVEIQLVSNWEPMPNNPLRIQIQKHPSHSAPRVVAVPDNLLPPSTPSLDTDLLEDSLFAPPPAAKPKKRRAKKFNPNEQLPSGGWYTDRLRLAVQYKPGGHADDVLSAIVELVNSSPSLGKADRIAIMNMPAVKSCIECHRSAEAGLPASWRGSPGGTSQKTFTKFSHRPHLNLPSLSNCSFCHEVAGTADQHELKTVSMDSDVNPHDFHPLTREACVKCHTARAAGDQCTKCHWYHIDTQAIVPQFVRSNSSTTK